jgi:hypothetical protein
MRRSGSRSNSVAPRTLAPSRFPHRNCASVRYYCNKTRPALQRIPARFSIARSELHREQHPGTLTCQKGACILAVVPHVLQALVLHFHHSTGRMHPADFSPACPIHARDRYADLDRRKQPALASLACTSLRGLHCTPKPQSCYEPTLCHRDMSGIPSCPTYCISLSARIVVMNKVALSPVRA